jgi:hypothetical protein
MQLSLSPQFSVMTEHAVAGYLDPRDREYAESLSGEERETVVATVARFRRPESLQVGDPLPDVELLRLEGAVPASLGSLVDGRPLVLVFGSFT